MAATTLYGLVKADPEAVTADHVAAPREPPVAPGVRPRAVEHLARRGGLGHARDGSHSCVASVSIEAVDQAVEEPGEGGVGREGTSGGGKGFGEFRVAAVGGDSGEIAAFGCGPVW